MSNYLAIATVTATLQRMIQTAIQQDVDGARVTTVRPNTIGNGTPETGVNVFLYQVGRNSALKNSDGAGGRSKGNATKRQTALELSYLISFYGNDTELEAQRLLGSTVRTFCDQSVMSSGLIQGAINDSTLSFLADSDLADQGQQMTIAPIDSSLEDLTKMWSAYFQCPYILSLLYKVTTVLIDGEKPKQRALPVRDRYYGGILPFPQQPIVEQVTAQAGRAEPILSSSTLLVKGRHLQGAMTRVQIGTAKVIPIEVNDNQTTVSLAAIPRELIRAGIQSLQVVHQGSTNDDQPRDVESNAIPFVLCPMIQSIEITNLKGRDDELRSGQITVQLDVLVGVKQRVTLTLNEWSATTPASYLFDADLRTVDADVISIAIQGVKAGEYLVRIQIDGAESLLGYDTDPDSPTFNWFNSPKIRID